MLKNPPRFRSYEFGKLLLEVNGFVSPKFCDVVKFVGRWCDMNNHRSRMRERLASEIAQVELRVVQGLASGLLFPAHC